MGDTRHEVLPGTLNLLILKTLATLGELHGYGIARRIEQVSGDLLELNQGTIYPALLKLEQMGWIRTRWSTSENNRRAKYYSLTRTGRKQLAREEDEWNRTAAIVTRFLTPSEK
jgi:transcriptional regulator